MVEKQWFFYASFVNVFRLVDRYKESRLAEKAARHLVNLIDAVPLKKIVLGPEKGLIAKVKNQYVFEIFVKYRKIGTCS